MYEHHCRVARIQKLLIARFRPPSSIVDSYFDYWLVNGFFFLSLIYRVQSRCLTVYELSKNAFSIFSKADPWSYTIIEKTYEGVETARWGKKNMLIEAFHNQCDVLSIFFYGWWIQTRVANIALGRATYQLGLFDQSLTVPGFFWCSDQVKKMLLG